MQSFLKNAFTIVGVMMLSLIIFALTLGDTGRSITWSFMEPVFQSQLDTYLFEDEKGEQYNQVLTENFMNIQDLDREHFNY